MTRRKTAVTATVDQRADDPSYGQLLDLMRQHFAASVANGAQLFTADAVRLFDTYLLGLPEELCSHHTCSSCRKFVEQFGGLVTINDKGEVHPVMWPQFAPEPYLKSFAALSREVSRARVTGVFLHKDHVWGNPSNLDKDNHFWQHFTVDAPAQSVHRDGLLTAGQKMAAIRENYATVQRALAEMKPEVLDQALRVFEGGRVDRADHFIGPVRWLRGLHDHPRGRAGDNMVWRAVAAAPEGYCHPRASVVWPLLESILEGKSFEFIKRQFESMVAPLRYQRPTEAPSSGTIKQAEEAFAKLGLESALERRFARMEDIQAYTWRPAALQTEATRSGIFAHIKPKDEAPTVPALELPALRVSWRKFKEEILPSADRLEIQVPGVGPFHAFTAAVHSDAGRMLKWDREDRRNSVAWYTFVHGSPASQWGLNMGAWATVAAVIPFPTRWGIDQSFLGDGELFAIAGCVDSQPGNGNALFPETLRADLHGVRSVIEAYSKKAELAGRNNSAVCGLAMRGGQGFSPLTVRAWIGATRQDYCIDRMD